ncbi:MAG TPA: xanthine dehydrogenase family protein molybdopterin-binding subunit [Anaerolineales bacterium]|nr:xanthine dehydrogenase family protein molybdopterin-binding subunit [Anaerolineales bacterium]
MKDQVSRRDFIKLVSVMGGGLTLAVLLEACTPEMLDEATPTIPANTSTPTPPEPFDWAPNIYLHMDHEGILTVMAFRSEMGQGIRTALAMLIADEMDVDWKNVRIEQVPADYLYGNQVTGGSLSISSSYNKVRQAGAAARQMLVSAAAQSWSLDPAECQTEAGFVLHPDGEQQIAYGALVQAASEFEPPGNARVKEGSQLRITGQGFGHYDAPDIITGKAIYGLDMRVPNMLFAVMARCPVFGGRVVSYDDSAARTVQGVRDVIEVDGKVAVVAENSWAAIQGRKALTIEWDEGRNAGLTSESLITEAMDGLPTPAPNSSPSYLSALYTMPYEAHATMEPMNCIAHVHDDLCEIWAPTQNPQQVWSDVATALGISRNNITVNVTLIGGGFGRRLETDYAVEAALVSQAVGAPVQVFWTRDDDFQHDYYQDMAVQYVDVDLENISMPNIRVNRGPLAIPTGNWRSVTNFPIAFSTQCFIHEMAVALERDMLDVLLELYSGRAAEVIKLAAEKAGWGNELPSGWGRGLAYHASFDVTYVAMVVDVSVGDDGNVKVHRVVCAVDCGRVINPDNVAAQMEGGIAFGLTAALKSEVTIKDGRVEQGNFNDYLLFQMSEMPTVETYFIESDHAPTGIGEMGVPPIAPALANAIFSATGKRVRHIPIRAEDLKA